MDKERLHVEFLVTVVNGDQGRRLAALQATAIVDALQWLADHHRATRCENSDADTEGPSR